ncbi:MAG: hypothetical protein CR979_01830 [Propionibacterium sp.]|nr:MAG: hypothetical protein CR979_01830 [Propionibacterium sp.]
MSADTSRRGKETSRSTADIQADLAASRAKLVSGVQGLIDDVNPKTIAKKTVEDAKTFVSNEFRAAKSLVADDEDWQVGKVIPVAGAVLVVVAVLRIGCAILDRGK